VATVRIAQDDYCTSAYLHAFGEATLTDETFQVNKELTSASLNATVLVINDAHDLFAYDVDLALTWTGTGELVRQSDRFHFHASDFGFQSRSNGTFRDAVASGSVSLAASLGDTNLTPQASMDAQDRVGEVWHFEPPEVISPLGSKITQAIHNTDSAVLRMQLVGAIPQPRWQGSLI